jgi:IclR family acetate operon transcriptional repressor
LHASALGKVFLAFGAEAPPGRLKKFSSRTTTSKQRLRADLVQVRERGWAIADGELEDGLIAVAAPIFSADGSVVGSMSISGPTLRMTREVTRDYAGLLVAATEATTASLAATSGSLDSGSTTVTQTGGRVGAA